MVPNRSRQAGCGLRVPRPGACPFPSNETARQSRPESAGGGLQPVAQAALARTCRSRSTLIKLVIQDIPPITQTQSADDLQRVLGSWGRLRAKKPGNDRPWRRFGRAQTAEHLFDCRVNIFDLFKQPGILYLHGVIAHLEDFAALKDE